MSAKTQKSRLDIKFGTHYGTCCGDENRGLTTPFVCTHRIHNAGTILQFVHTKRILDHFYDVTQTVCKISAHDATLKIWAHFGLVSRQDISIFLHGSEVFGAKLWSHEETVPWYVSTFSFAYIFNVSFSIAGSFGIFLVSEKPLDNPSATPSNTLP